MLIYYNPHVDDFIATPLQFKLFGRRALRKYGFLINQPKALNKINYVIVDGSLSGVIPNTVFIKLPKIIKSLVSNIEFHIWKYINNFKGEIVKVSLDSDFSDCVLLAFSYKAAIGDFDSRRHLLSRFNITIFHLSHYFISTNEKSENLRKLNNVILAGDSNITNNKYYRNFFDWYKGPFLVLPFAVSDKFKNCSLWENRQNRIVSTGTFHDLAYEKPSHLYSDFIRITGMITYHPIRKAIFDVKDKVKISINCKNSQYREYSRTYFMKFLDKFKISQRDYFAMDIVNLYNNYRYAVIGEELSGFPAIGAFEAMACGCILFAEAEYYLGLNLYPGKDFIEYDTGLDGLLLKFNNKDQYFDSKFSKAISEKIRANFNESAVYDQWLQQIANTKLIKVHAKQHIS